MNRFLPEKSAETPAQKLADAELVAAEELLAAEEESLAAAEEAQVQTWPWWIMGGLLVWGGLLAVGGFLFGGNYPLLRAVIIFACTLLFVGFWALLLRLRPVERDGL